MIGTICSRCEKHKDFSEFYTNKKSPTGHNYSCKVCEKAYQLEYKRAKRKKPMFHQEELKRDRDRWYNKQNELNPNRKLRTRKDEKPNTPNNQQHPPH